MSKAAYVKGREILFYRGVNYEWCNSLGAYSSVRGEPRELQADELDEALRESGSPPTVFDLAD